MQVSPQVMLSRIEQYSSRSRCILLYTSNFCRRLIRPVPHSSVLRPSAVRAHSL